MDYVKIILISMTVLMTACASNTSQAQNTSTDWEEYELKGCVKQLIIHTYKAHKEVDSLVKDDLWSTVVIDFSKDGKLLQVERKGESKKTYSYTKNQQIIKEYDESRVLTGQTVTNYTKWGAIKSIVYYNPYGAETAKWDYTYDQKRQLVERLYQNNYYQYTKEENIQFDATGHEIRCERYDKEHRLKEIEIHTYDANGKLILKNVDRYEGGAYSYGGSTRFSYNPEGFVSMLESANDTGEYQVTHIITYVYDNQGNYVTKNNMYDWWPSIQERTIIYY